MNHKMTNNLIQLFGFWYLDFGFPAYGGLGVVMEEIQIGKVAHYFSHLGVAAIDIVGQLKVGDKIHFKGHTTDFVQVVDSMQSEHASLDITKAGDKIGIKTKENVREHDIVYKVVE